MTDNLLSMDLAAIRARVSVSTVQRYVALKKLQVAKRGKYGQVYLDPLVIDEWAVWLRKCQKERAEARRKGASPLARVNGMMLPGQLSCEKQDESDRERLFLALDGDDPNIAREALAELREKYHLRLPLREQQLGMCLEDIRC